MAESADPTRQISENQTRFVRWMGKWKRLSQLYGNYLVAPFWNNAYIYPSLVQYGEGRSMIDIMNGFSCSGMMHTIGMLSCKKLCLYDAEPVPQL